MITRKATARSAAPRGDQMTKSGEPRVVGPGFHDKVYKVVRRVPAGKVTTYGDVGTMLGSPRVARQVGYALAALDEGTTKGRGVPWHRVINAKGAISFKGDLVRATLQRALLLSEGVPFDPSDRVPLAELRYDYGKGRKKR